MSCNRLQGCCELINHTIAANSDKVLIVPPFLWRKLYAIRLHGI